VTVTLDGAANDGQPGENDNVKEIEIVEGTAFSDTLSGNLGEARYRIRRGRKDQIAVHLARGSRSGLRVIATGKDREGEGTTTLFRVR
jgi:hypothetical protein